MAATGNTTTKLQHWLDLLRRGDDLARNELIGLACERFRTLTRRMLRGYPALRQWEQTDDVLQNAMIRLHRALADMTPESLHHFYNLATLQVRRELRDLAKHHSRSDERRQETLTERAVEVGEPSNLAEWSEFHRQVDALPEDEREVFGLIWYGDLTQAEAASVLGVSVRTVIRRWQSARVRLQRTLRGGGGDDGHR
jgi:RNA polymerase sigma factor (sigma-70 family)